MGKIAKLASSLEKERPKETGRRSVDPLQQESEGKGEQWRRETEDEAGDVCGSRVKL